MNEYKKITFSIPLEVLERYKSKSQSQGKSLSKVLTEALTRKDWKLKHKTQRNDRRLRENLNRYRLDTECIDSLKTIANYLDKLELKGEISYSKAVNYLLILENIEMKLNLLLETVSQTTEG